MRTCPFCRISFARNIKDKALEGLYRAIRPPPTYKWEVIDEETEEGEEEERENNWQFPHWVRPERREEEEGPRTNEEQPVRSNNLEMLSIAALSEKIEAVKLVLPERLWANARLNPDGGVILDIS